MSPKDVGFYLFIAVSLGLGVFSLRERKLEDEEKIRFAAEISVAQEVVKIIFPTCDAFYRGTLIPTFNQVDPSAFGYATIPHTWNEGLAEVAKEKGAPIAPGEWYPKGSDKSDAVAVIVRREKPDLANARVDVHVFGLVKPLACGYTILHDTRFRESIVPAVYFVYQYWLYSDGRTEKM